MLVDPAGRFDFVVESLLQDMGALPDHGFVIAGPIAVGSDPSDAEVFVAFAWSGHGVNPFAGIQVKRTHSASGVAYTSTQWGSVHIENLVCFSMAVAALGNAGAGLTLTVFIRGRRPVKPEHRDELARHDRDRLAQAEIAWRLLIGAK